VADALVPLVVADRSVLIAPIDPVGAGFDVGRLPYTLRILLENVTHAAALGVGGSHEIQAIAAWEPSEEPGDSAKAACSHCDQIRPHSSAVAAIASRASSSRTTSPCAECPPTRGSDAVSSMSRRASPMSPARTACALSTSMKAIGGTTTVTTLTVWSDGNGKRPSQPTAALASLEPSIATRMRTAYPSLPS
jgi:hypothetical protein